MTTMIAILVGLASLGGPDDPAPWTFVDRAAEGGVAFRQRSGSMEQRYIVEVKSTGAALLDVDGDGLLDVFFTQGSTIENQRAGKPGYGCRLYRNLGHFRFRDITEEAGIPATGWACGVAAADVEGDGDDDLLITCYGPDLLLENRGGKFVDRSAEAGLQGSGWSASAAFSDLDGDGDLDLYVTGYLEFDFSSPPVHGEGLSCLWNDQPVVCGPRGLPPRADRVYANDGQGKFTEVTEAWGFAAVPPRYGLAVVIADLVGDPAPDVFVANDAAPNFLFKNDGGRFEDVAFQAGVGYSEDGQEQAGMGTDAIDIDGNGHLDVIVTNFENERNNLYLNST